MTQNQISFWKNQEDKRSHLAQEAETARANRAREAISRDTNSINLQLGQGNLAESTRSAKARELENTRTNKENELIKRYANDIAALNAQTNSRNADTNFTNALTNASTLAEQIRTNKANEGIKVGNLLELNRSNLAKEAENERSNRASENNVRFANATGFAANSQRNNLQEMQNVELNRHNLATELETKRSNLIEEQLKAAGLLETINNNRARNLNQSIANMNGAIGNFSKGVVKRK